MLYCLLFLSGLLLGLLPVLRRALESLRFAWLCHWASKRGISAEELSHDEVLRRLEFAPTPKPTRRLRRAK